LLPKGAIATILRKGEKDGSRALSCGTVNHFEV